ncbi:cysteine dioxygenase 1 [Eurytemora carolleeae]|uniref:cysteine dioxygenase 1 n=1 Tax=Eurytemora carolleeae TaxID=1294199 RepID=UPI000C7860AA|nr:cysteine dioxygenase 1 [Eurytemora carolleeae]XP_023338816.1 cysteine dioxygenase 1 [Eurytemora carolleeae]|eukprot:XP_023338815.1 cysteine dioxygenase 1-like [Eurytemora affinis]
MDCKASITFDELLDGLLEYFKEGKENVNVEEVISWFSRYKNDPKDWVKFAKWDKYKYTRNLIHKGNGNFNLILMCWPEGVISPIHDHSDSHCFMRVLEGEVREIRYAWPEEVKNEDGSLQESGTRTVGAGETIYMSDELGLHRVENPSHMNKLTSIHLYSPPFDFCKVFDPRTAKRTKINMVFYSKFGEKEDTKKAKTEEKAVSKV